MCTYLEYYDIDYFHRIKDSLPVLGYQELREILADMLFRVRINTIDDVLENCVFLMVEKEKLPGSFTHKKLIRDKHLLAFHDVLFSLDKEKREHIIYHEIAHYCLDHIDEDLDEKSYRRMNEEANALVDEWHEDYEEHWKEEAKKAREPWKAGNP